MERFHNYHDTSSIELLISEIEKTIEAKLYLAALHMALSIPDMLGKLAYPKFNGNKYIKWFDENVRSITFGYLYSENPLGISDDGPKMCGEVCYALRCKLFHEGVNDIKARTKVRINEFVLSFTDEDFVRGNYAGKDYEFDKYDPKTNTCPEINYLYISCKGLCKEIVMAAKAFCKNNPDLDYPKLRINKGHGKVSDIWLR